ncbi:MAG: flippase [Chloroflexota bacterium]
MDKRFRSNLFKGLASTSFGSIATIGFHFLSILLMTRYVPKDVLGAYFLAFAIVQVLGITSGLGLDLTLVKSVAGADRNQQQDVVASIVTIRFISVTVVGIIFFAVGRFILPVFDARLSDFIMLMIPFFILASYRDLFLRLMQGVRQFMQHAVVEILSAVTRVILLIAFHNSLSLQSLLYIEIISQLIEVLLQIFFLRALLFSLAPNNIKAESVRNLTRFSTPLYANNVLTLVYDRSSTFLIGALLNPTSVAAFEVALKIPDGFMRLFNSFIVVYFPNLSNLFAKGHREDAHKMMNRFLVLLSTGIIFLVLVAFLFGKEIVLVLFSEEYLEVSLAFAFLMLNFYLRAVSNILGYSLVASGNSSAPVRANIVSSTVNVVASLVLIRAFGYIGAAYSLLLMNVTSQIIYELLLRRSGLTPYLLGYLKPVLLLTLALSIYWSFGIDSTLLKFLLVGIYVAGSWLFIGEIRWLSRTAVKRVFSPRVRSKSAWYAISEDEQ